MSATFIGFLAFCFVGMTLVNRIMEGALISATDVSILNQITVFRTVDLFNLFPIPVPNLQFLTEGIPHLIKWDYSYFGGNASIFQYFLYSITAAAAFGLFITMAGVIAGSFLNRTR